MPRLYRVILPVHDIEKAVDFYGHVLGVAGERVSPGRHYFDCGGVILACYDPTADGDLLEGGWKHHPNQYVYLAVDDLEAALGRVERAGGTVQNGGIAVMPWGERLFYFSDPFGTPVCLVDERTMFQGTRR